MRDRDVSATALESSDCQLQERLLRLSRFPRFPVSPRFPRFLAFPLSLRGRPPKRVTSRLNSPVRQCLSSVRICVICGMRRPQGFGMLIAPRGGTAAGFEGERLPQRRGLSIHWSSAFCVICGSRVPSIGPGITGFSNLYSPFLQQLDPPPTPEPSHTRASLIAGTTGADRSPDQQRPFPAQAVSMLLSENM